MDNDRWEREKEERLRKHISRLKDVGIVSRVIEGERERFEHEGNIYSAWYAYLIARQTGAAIPDWILEAFDDVSTRLFGLYLNSTHDIKITNADIAKAVKLSGKRGEGNAFTKYGSPDWWLMADVVGLYMGQGDGETHAIEAVAEEYRVSKSTVRRAWKRYKTARPERVAKLLSFTKSPLS